MQSAATIGTAIKNKKMTTDGTDYTDGFALGIVGSRAAGGSIIGQD